MRKKIADPMTFAEKRKVMMRDFPAGRQQGS
jgi:hypothetical protein